MSQEFTRGAGILLPITSLPSPYGIGTLGKEARDFIDFLAESGQKYWQVLPVGPIGYGDSPYQSFSAFAGNPYLIDLDTLIEEGLLKKEEAAGRDWGKKADTISYECIYKNRYQILQIAYKRHLGRATREQKQFREENKYWLDDYALYMACKEHFGSREWSLWEDDIRTREPKAMRYYHKKLEDRIQFWKFCQFKFYEQWNRMRSYAKGRGISLIGDLPIYVAMDSADVWSRPRNYQLDEDLRPTRVAGVPPDAFTSDGQLWGNPLYNWNHLEKEDFSWWIERMKASVRLFDVIRIDHFIGMVRYYSIPADAANARVGNWVMGPGQKLTKVLSAAIGDCKLIAEDLGVVTEEVKRLREEHGYPGMKIMEFAFDAGADNEHAPHHHTRNCVVYGGTHDNETLVGFLDNKQENELAYAYAYLGVHNKQDLLDAIFRAVYGSVANVAVMQMQDILRLGNSARMNCPGSIGGNWQWRLPADRSLEQEKAELKEYMRVYGR